MGAVARLVVFKSYGLKRSAGWRWLAGTLAVTIAMTTIGQQPARAGVWKPPAAQDVAGIAARDVRATAPVSWTADGRMVRGPREVVWPAPVDTTVRLSEASVDGSQVLPKFADVRAGATSVRLANADSGDVVTSRGPSSPRVSSARVQVYDRAATAKASVDGMLLSVSRADGRTRSDDLTVEVDYSGFANAFGAGWASRLRVVQLQECARSTPLLAECQQRLMLPTSNNAKNGVLSAQVPVGEKTTLLAIMSGPSGDGGSFSATPLSQAGTWSVGTQTGDFTWSTSMRMPPAMGSPVPSVSLAYASGSIDGRTATTNNQGGWIGDGWDSWPGYIERRYAGCTDDNPSHQTGDQCWFNSNATLSMNGRAGELVETGTANVWRLKNDDGTRIERLTDAARGNGDNDSEYWKVTTIDGVQYFFGYHKLPNWASGNAVTDSVWTVPVNGNNPTEPCYNATFGNAFCDQAWRWNLDYVVDPRGNSMTYFYGKETGWYGRDNTPSQRTAYVRGGWVDRIEYGTRNGSEYSAAAPMRVVFATAERCLSGCWSGAAWASDPVDAAWPDTPLDQDCAVAPCTSQLSPTFWSMRRLSKVTTQVRSAATAYRDVESWALRHEFLAAGDNEGAPMWLRGITRTGHVTTAGGVAASEPEIVFNPGAEPLPNRVDRQDGRTLLNRFRIKDVTTESGGQIKVTYSGPDCDRFTLPTGPESNTKRCMPAFYSPAGTPTLDWFHKYVVTAISLHDTTADGTTAPSNHDQKLFYDYLDTPAWHYNDDELTKPAFKTWGDWRGYTRVQVRSGSATGQQTAVEYRYLRGMNGDKLPSGVRQNITVGDSWGVNHEDHEALRGFQLQTITLNGSGGAEVASTVNMPWLQGPTASRTRNGVTVNAWIIKTGTTRSRAAAAAGGYRTSKTTTTFNSDGLPTSVDDFGDENETGDETCSRTIYARNDTIWMIDKAVQVESLSGTCAAAATPAVPANVLGRSRTFYDTYVDSSSFGATPTRGLPVRTEELDAWSGSTPVYAHTSTVAHDTSGRIVETRDALNSMTTTGFTTDAATGLVTSTTVTNALNQSATTYVEPAWGQPTKTVDPNGIVTEMTYDGLGRTTNVWLPGRNKATQSASMKFSYLVRSSGGPSAVTTESLTPQAQYRKSVVFYDGFLRHRQTQTQATGGGRTVTDTIHNAFGVVDWASSAYYDSTGAAVSTTLASTGVAIPAVTTYTYDGVGRTTAIIFVADGVEKWRTTTGYLGERVNLTPPAGGIATTTINDISGKTTELRQYKAFADVGSDDPAKFDKTVYEYNVLGQLKKLIDPAGNQWTHSYDLRGRPTQTTDPDAGTATTTYDAGGQVETVAGPLGTLAYTYDALGRRTTTRDNSVTGTIRAEWLYDTLTNGIGKLTSSTRYAGGNAYVSKVDTIDAFGRPTSTSVVLPAAQSDLCAAATPNTCTYTTTMTYRPNGAPSTISMPAAADLVSEKLTLGYTDVGNPGTQYSASQIYVNAIVYNKLDQVTSRTLGPGGYQVAQGYSYDEPTGRLTAMNVAPELKPEAVDYNYTYDNAGNITKISDVTQGATADHQCFQYDYLQRLTEAWTPSIGDCSTAKTVGDLGGPAPYWNSWTFNAIGSRLTEIRHAATNTTHTYTYPASGPTSLRPHTVTNVTATGGQAWSRNYSYDTAGNTVTRPNASGATQTLAWDRGGKTTSLTEGTAVTTSIYDADGNRLIRRDPDGSKTLYLGHTEVRNVGTVKTATRYIAHAGEAIAMRTAAGVHWITGDHHGTAELTIKASDLTVAKRRMLPYGEERGTTTGTWATGMDKGFVGGTNDPTGLTHMGAREYDPAIGRFVSVDPIIDIADPQQMHGYSYSSNNPVTLSDPSGLLQKEPESGCSSMELCELGNAQMEYDKALEEIEKAKAAKKKSFTDILIKEGLAFLLDIIGITDIVNCFTKGDLMACGSMLIGALPIGRLAKIGKSIWKAVDKGLSAFKTWKKTMAAADAVLSKADDMIAAAKSKLDDALSKTDSCHSFDPATPVLMADGTAKPIAQVELGDQVVATDPLTGATTAQPVTALHINQDIELTDVTISPEPARPATLGEGYGGRSTRGPTQSTTLHTTQNHPFWDSATGNWIDAADLTPGRTTVIGPDGQIQYVIAVRNFTGSQDMRDLTVDNIHTYYVLAGNTPVLVHNTGPACGVPAGVKNLKDGNYMATSDAMDTAVEFLGTGYRDMGGGRFLQGVVKVG